MFVGGDERAVGEAAVGGPHVEEGVGGVGVEAEELDREGFGGGAVAAAGVGGEEEDAEGAAARAASLSGEERGWVRGVGVMRLLI